MATVKINIGSRTNVAYGWINYDISICIALSKYGFLKKLLLQINEIIGHLLEK